MPGISARAYGPPSISYRTGPGGISAMGGGPGDGDGWIVDPSPPTAFVLLLSQDPWFSLWPVVVTVGEAVVFMCVGCCDDAASWAWACAPFALFLRRQKKQNAVAAMSSTPKATPTPIPTLAPVDKPPGPNDDSEVAVLLLVSAGWSSVPVWKWH